MSWRRNHKHLKNRHKEKLVNRFINSYFYSDGSDARQLIGSGWIPEKNILDNIKQKMWYSDKGSAIWDYLNRLSTGDVDSSSAAQGSQALSIAQKLKLSRDFSFGEHRSSSMNSVMW